MIEAEILEVNRKFVRQLGIDFSQWALGFTFSPEVAPPNTGTVANAIPAQPPPFNLNTLSQGVSAADFYLTSPSALISLLESNQKTKVLARPQLRGRDGAQMQLRLGDLVPIPTTVFNSAAAGGIANVPTTSVNYQSVGVNLNFTPRVTYQDEIILDNLLLEKSGLGAFINVGGQDFPTIVSRSATASVRLRDGESNLLAGLLSDQDRTTIKSLPGLTKLPILRSIFGNSDSQVDQTDIVMIITPRILRSHELKPSDLRPMYIGSGSNFGAGAAPPLISPDAPIGGTGGAAPPTQPLAGPPGAGAPPPTPIGGDPQPAAPPPPAPPTATRAPGVVPIQAVPAGGQPATPAAASRPTISITMPSGPEGLAAGGGPYTAPIQITGAENVSTMSISLNFNPSVLKPLGVTPGTFMNQGGVSATFVPGVDAANGRIDIAISRPASQGGASGQGLLASITFQAGAAGSGQVTMTGVATATTGQPIPLVFTGATVIVK